MITRRTLLVALGASAATISRPTLVRAQPAKPYRIGFLAAASASTFAPRVDALLTTFRQLGYVEGRDFAMEYRWAEGKPDRLPDLAMDLARLNVDVIVTSATPATLAAKRATASIPIVMTVVGNAVESGIVANLARPGANVTGVTFLLPQLIAKRLEILKEVVTSIGSVAVLVNPDNKLGFGPVVEALKVAAGQMRVKLQSFEVRGSEDFPGAFAAITRSRVDAIVIVDDTMIITNAKAIAELTIVHRLPSIGFAEFTDAGGLMAYGIDRLDMYRRAAYFVDRILKGVKPVDLPVELPTRFEFVVNTKAAATLGIKVPSSILIRADRVIS